MSLSKSLECCSLPPPELPNLPAEFAFVRHWAHVNVGVIIETLPIDEPFSASLDLTDKGSQVVRGVVVHHVTLDAAAVARLAADLALDLLVDGHVRHQVLLAGEDHLAARYRALHAGLRRRLLLLAAVHLSYVLGHIHVGHHHSTLWAHGLLFQALGTL